jgi:hypothetical protein
MTDTRNTFDPSVRELPLPSGGELELRLGSGNLRVRIVDGDRVVLRGHTDHDLERELEIETGEGWIRVTDGPAGSFRIGPLTVRGNGHGIDLDVDVPRNVRISGRTLSGDIQAYGVSLESRWQSASGDIHIGAEGGPITIETMSGSALVDARNPIALTCRTVSGSVGVRAPRIFALDIATTSGDTTVEASLDEGGTHAVTSVSGDFRLITGSDVAVELQTVAGDLRASMPHRAEGTRSRRLAVVGAGRVRVSVKTMSGDVNLQQGAADPASGPAIPRDPAPRPSYWADFGREWADFGREFAKDWASWGKSWAEGIAYGKPPATRPIVTWSPPESPVAPSAPATPKPPASAPAPESAEPVVAEAEAEPNGNEEEAPEAPAAADVQSEAVADEAQAEPEAAAEAEASGDEAAAPPADDEDFESLEDTSPVPQLSAADVEAARLDVLRALERGELDVETASERLSALESAAGHREA